MVAQSFTLALALLSAVNAAPFQAVRRDECMDAYNACIAAGTAQVACSCTLSSCTGEDDARNRDFCATATASLSQASATTTYACNPAHSYPGGASCVSTSGGLTLVTPAATTAAAATTYACNPAHSYPGGASCVSTSGGLTLVTPTASSPAKSSAVSSAVVSAASAAATVANAAPGSTPVKVDGKTWTIEHLTRYCGDGNTGCDYNFGIEANGKSENCTIIRMPGSDAANESWSNQNCTTGSDFKVSWGYVANPAPAFAVITIVEGKELAWFGASDINGAAVTASNPYGSKDFGDLAPEQVYTYN